MGENVTLKCHSNNSDLIASIEMQIKCKSLRRTSHISYQSGNHKYINQKVAVKVSKN